MGVSEEKREELVEALGHILLDAGVINYSITEVANRLTDQIIEEGWQWHPPKVEEPLADWEKDLLNNDRWKDLPVMNYPDFEINPEGHIRNRHSKEIIHPKYDEDYNRYLVTLSQLNGDWVKIDGKRMAEDLFTPAKKAEDVEPTWVRIPKFEDYEVNSLGVVRNFWTKRVLGVRGTDAFVELHDDQGYPRNMTVKAVMEKAFPKED